MTEQHGERLEAKRTRRDRWFIGLVFLVFLIGLGLRGYGYVRQTSSSHLQSRPRGATGLTHNTEPQTSARSLSPLSNDLPEEGDWLTLLAPFLTEGGLSFFLGFCIGYVLRLVAKTAIILVGALYCCLILLSHYGMVTVDWGSLYQLLEQVLLNTQTHMEGFRGILTASLPSAAMGGIGIWRGLKRP